MKSVRNQRERMALHIQQELLLRMRDVFQQMQANGTLHHGSGLFDYGDWSLLL